MKHFPKLLVCAALFGGSLAGHAQDYHPFIPVCVVDGGTLRTGMTARYAYEGKWYVVGFCSSACRIKFLQNPAPCMANALEALASAPKVGGKKVSPEATGPCDLKHTVKSPWCASCARELARDDVHNGLCKKCENKPVQAEFCVKAGTPEDRARITYRCEACNATADIESMFKHEPDCKPKPGSHLIKVCTKSGMAPHATEVK